MMATPNIKMKKRKEKTGGVCCDESKLTCDTCSFEESIAVNVDEDETE
jgi:hypothetical protein